jgi:hypothetical protein
MGLNYLRFKSLVDVGIGCTIWYVTPCSLVVVSEEHSASYLHDRRVSQAFLFLACVILQT